MTIRRENPIDVLGEQLAFTAGRLKRQTQQGKAASERRRKVGGALRADPTLTAADLAERFEVSRSTAARDLTAVRRMLTRGDHCPICGHVLSEDE